MWKKKKKTTPRAMRVGMLMFIAWMAYVGLQGEKKATEGDPSAVSVKRYEVIQRFSDIDRWRKVANPSFNRTIEFKDLQTGNRDSAGCGQQVKLRIAAIPQEGQQLDASLSPKEPVIFTIGDKQALEAWDRGVRGMRAGGVRRIFAGARLVDNDNQDVDAKPVIFDLELLELKPNLPENSVPSSPEIVRAGAKELGDGSSCGEPMAFLLKLFKTDKTPLFESDEKTPLRLTLGKDEYGQGLDRGLVGMYVGEIRRLTIPPVYQPKNSDIPFPKGEIAIVEVLRVPYNETVQGETSPVQQPEDEPKEDNNREPDSQPTERDQTLPDDGSDSQGGGT